MSDTTVDLLAGVIIALAKTWDNKLPGYRAEFSKQLGHVYMQTPPADIALRNALDAIIQALDAA
jgi:hypothetical protein